MGYYSEVVIVMHKNDLRDMIRKAAMTGMEDVLSLVNNAEVYSKEGSEDDIVTLRWDYVKWYDRCPQIRFIMDFIQGEDRQYRFARIGEETGDLEEHESVRCDDDFYECAMISSFVNIESAGEQRDIDDFFDGNGLSVSEGSESNGESSEISDKDFANIIDA